MSFDGWDGFNLNDKINNKSNSVAALSCCSCLIFIGHKLYYKLNLSSTWSMFSAVVTGPDSHIIIHILFHIEIFYIKLLNCTFVTDGHLGKLIVLSSCS